LNSFSGVLFGGQSLLQNFVIFFPGILTYLVYISLSDDKSKGLNKIDLIYIFGLALFFEIFRGVLDVSSSRISIILIYFIAPLLLGLGLDVFHRFIVTYILSQYSDTVLKKLKLDTYDTSNISRWVKTLRRLRPDPRESFEDSLFTKVKTEGDIIKGYLVGSSKEDIELMSYEEVGEPKTEECGSYNYIRGTILIPKEKIEFVKIYAEKMEENIPKESLRNN